MIKIIIYTLLAIILNNTIYANDWKQIGFEGKTVYCVAVNPVDKNIIYTGIKNEGIYNSIDAGQSWNLIYETKQSINCIVIDRFDLSKIYAGYNDGVLLSKNGGKSFEQIIIEKNININNVILDETQTKAIILGCNKGLYKSFDNGKTFIKSGLSNFSISCLAINNAGSKAIIYASTTNTGIFKSANYGTSWTPINNGLTNLQIYSIICDLRKPSELYLGTINENVYKSNNEGESWKSVFISNTINQGYVFAQTIDNTDNSSVIYLTSFSGDVFKITKNGSLTVKISEPMKDVYGTCLGIANILPSTLYFGTTSGLYMLEE